MLGRGSIVANPFPEVLNRANVVGELKRGRVLQCYPVSECLAPGRRPLEHLHRG